MVAIMNPRLVCMMHNHVFNSTTTTFPDHHSLLVSFVPELIPLLTSYKASSFSYKAHAVSECHQLVNVCIDISSGFSIPAVPLVMVDCF